MKTLRIIIFFAASLIFSPAIATAQDTTTSRKTMRLTAFGTQANDLFYEQNGQKVEIHAAPAALTEPLPLPKEKTLRLYREVPPPADAPAGAKPLRQEVGAVELPEGSKLIVVLVIPQDLNKSKVQGKAYKDSYQNHRSETARVFNMYTKEVALKAGKEGIQLPVGESGFIPWKATAYASVAYQLAVKGQKPGTWSIVENSECLSLPNYRAFIFVAEVTEWDGSRTLGAMVCTDPIPDMIEE